jgi:integrase-like protein
MRAQRLEGLDVRLGGHRVRSWLQVTGVGAYHVVVETVSPDRGIELHSSYTGHPQIAESRFVHLELAPGRHVIRSEVLMAGEVPVVSARRRCLLDHLAALVDLLRMRIEPPQHAEALIEAAPEDYRAYWALALFAGLRRGELRALRCSDLDIRESLVNVSRGWDDHEGEQDTKTEKGERSIPLSGRVRKELAAHLLRTGRSGDDLVFGRTAELPFIPTTVRHQTLAAWKKAGLEPLTTHEARHCAISYFVASGFDWKEATVYADHAM